MNDFKPAQSPYSKDFESILDPDIRNLVMTLLRKGYLPCYSCQGHALHKPRYVILAFGYDHSRNKFIQDIFKNARPFGYPLKNFSTLNTDNIRGKIFEHQTRDNEVLGFNQMFMRNYENYCFLRINIGMVIFRKDMGVLSFKSKQIFVSGFNLFFRRWLTQKLVHRVSQLEVATN